MANLLNSIIANQPINPVKKQEQNTAFTFSSEGKIKPMKDKGRLLPSKIFDSPVDIAKDFKGDIVSIGKAARGKANDHELGRINDLAMKIGGIALAAYLCTKNTQKLSKAMEFVGFGTFFGAMSLWPKLTIQAPIRARTGVDVHQKYIDSQGRKKMLFQDPQYVLTDLYSREDLDKMGKKLGVAENLPDRDNFIKRRAEKTALQANTLWMMTAGGAPIFSALACNRLEQPVNTIIENSAMVSSEATLNRVLNPQKAKSPLVQKAKTFVSNLSQKADDAAFERYLKSGKVTPEGLAQRIAGKAGNVKLNDTLAQQISSWVAKPTLAFNEVINSLNGQNALCSMVNSMDETVINNITRDLESGNIQRVANRINNIRFGDISQLTQQIIQFVPQGADSREAVKTALKGNVNDAIIESLDKLTEKQFRDLTSGKERKVEALLTTWAETERKSLVGLFTDRLGQKAKKSVFAVTDDFASNIRTLRTSVSGYAAEQGKLNKFISARVGQKSNTHIANQWDRVWNGFFKSLNLSNDDLLKLANDGDLSRLTDKIDDLVKDDARYDKAVTKLMKLIETYEAKTGDKQFLKQVETASQSISEKAKTSTNATIKTLEKASKDSAITSSLKKFVQSLDGITTGVTKHAENRALGARSSFYRLAQTLDVFKKANDGTLATQIRTNLSKHSPDLTGKALDDAVENLVQVSKKIILSAGSTDYTEKLTTDAFKLSAAEYKSVMSVLFDSELDTTITTSLKKSMSKERATKLVDGLKKYQQEFMENVVNWKNPMKVDLVDYVVGNPTTGQDAQKRSNLVASEVTKAIKRTAENKYNSNKWLKIFGISFAVITAATLIAGLFLGRKSETEKQVEAESKVNG